MKRLLAFLISGLAVGIIVSTLFVPTMIAWYFEPPVDIGVNCRPAVDWALTRFVWFQVGGGALGLGLGLLAYFQSKPKAAQITK